MYTFQKCQAKSNKAPLHINTDSLGIAFHESNGPKNMASPLPSPSSSSSSSSSSPHKSISRSKCQLNRPQQSLPKVTGKSYESIKSPAASFLAGFAFSPVQTRAVEEEQEGDEIDDYVIDKIIGYGGFSTVRKGFRISDGQHVAIKIIKKQDMQVDMRLERELDIWKQLDHHNIVCLQKVLDTDHATFLICDYCPGGSLLDLLNKKSLTESEARRIFVQLCDAIRYLHEDAKVCHKDLKLENILLQDNDHVKLCDFGLAMCQQPLKINPVTHLPLSPDLSDSDDNCAGGSLAYAAPEQIKSTKAIGCPSTDIWSLGVILYALVTGKLPYSDNYDLRLQQKILHGEFEMPTFVSPELQLLLRHCLESDPQKRYTIQHILQSSWCTAL